MSLKTLALALVAAAPFASASPLPEENAGNQTMGIQAAPQWYSGPWYNFPAMSTWRSFDDLVSEKFLPPVTARREEEWGGVGKIRIKSRRSGGLKRNQAYKDHL